MIDFGMDLTTSVKTHQVAQEAPAALVETITVRPIESASYALKEASLWGWSELRDYVMTEIEKRHGPQVRDPKKEAGIFKSFMTRWPGKSVQIAQSAFGPVHNGMWRGAPISINRFCKASDEYFAAILAERI